MPLSFAGSSRPSTASSCPGVLKDLADRAVAPGVLKDLADPVAPRVSDDLGEATPATPRPESVSLEIASSSQPPSPELLALKVGHIQVWASRFSFASCFGIPCFRVSARLRFQSG